MIQTYTKGSNPYFEYASKVYSQIEVVNRMKKDDVLEHINTLNFQSVANVWELIHTHLENVNLSLNAYNYPNYALPTTEKPTDKFDFITKNSKAMGAYQSGVLVNDFSYFVDSNIIAKSKANEFSQRKYEMLHKVSAFTHLENKAELASVEARKAFFEAFLTILHRLHNADFEAKLNQINAELAPHLFVPEKYIRLENRQKTIQKMVEVVIKKPITNQVKKYNMFAPNQWNSNMSSVRNKSFEYVGGYQDYSIGDGVVLNYFRFAGSPEIILMANGYGLHKALSLGRVYSFGEMARLNSLYNTDDIGDGVSITSPMHIAGSVTIMNEVVGYEEVVENQLRPFNIPYMIEVEYQTQYGKDKLPNETPPAEPYKIKKLNGSWVTHCGVLLDTEDKSEDEILQMENPPCPPQTRIAEHNLTIEQIDSVISWIDKFNDFYNQNEATQLTNDLTFGDWYAMEKSGIPAYTSYPYTDFFKKLALNEPLDYCLDTFRDSKTAQVVEILQTIPNTKYKGGDLIELSKQEMILERQRLENENA